MAVDVVTEIVIDRPCAQVAAYAGDPSHAPKWYANIESVVLHTPGAAGLGSKMDFVARFLGRRLAYTYEIVDAYISVAVGSRGGACQRDGRGAVPFSASSRRWISISSSR